MERIIRSIYGQLIFDPIKDRKVDLQLLLVFFGLLLIGIGTLAPLPESIRFMSVAYMIVSLFFLSTTHVAYSFVLLATLPELKSFAVEKYGSTKSFVWRLGLVFSLTFLFFLAGQSFFIPAGSSWGPLVFIASFYFFESALVFHSIRQSLGISTQYSHEAVLKNPESAKQIEASSRSEKNLIWLIILVDIGIKIGWLLQFVGVISGDYKIGTYGAWVVFSLVAPIVLFIWRSPGRKRKLFSLRYLLRPFAYTVPFSNIIMLALHGLEYDSVGRQMVRRSNLSTGKKKWVGQMIWVAVITIGILGLSESKSLVGFIYNTAPNLPPVRIPEFLRVGHAALWALVVTHIYMDSVIFRMKDPSARKNIGGLLKFQI